MTIFMRLMDVSVDEKAAALREVVGANEHPRVFEREPSAFASVPGSPFAYWVSNRVLSLFATPSQPDRFAFEAWVGLQTNQDFRWLRLTWEVSTVQYAHWYPFAKGGAYAPFYSDVYLLVRWNSGGRDLKEWKVDQLRLEKITANNSRCWNETQYFRPGLTWPRRTNGLSFRVLPNGCIFADKGPAAFVDGDDPAQILALSALMNSAPFGYLVSVQLARTELAQSYEVGLIQQTPIPNLSDIDTKFLAKLARRAWSLKRSLDTVNETSHAFVLPLGINEKVAGLDSAAIQQELVAIQREIDNRAFDLYGISAEDRATIEAPHGQTPHPPSPLSNSASLRGEGEEKEDVEEETDEDESSAGPAGVALLSWLVGVAFGRFDPRLAMGKRPVPPEPEPFDPLPARSPGMWPADEPHDVPPPAILVDDAGHARDLCAHVDAAATNVGASLPEDLRTWLAHEFFPLHIKMYSKSRRKAPIYWQLATPSASYSVWIYLHAFTKDTLYTVQNDYVVPKVELEERKLEGLRREIGDAPKAADRKRLTQQETFVEELHGFVEEIKRVAPLWNPNLDDGVVINFAPLWKLVSHNKPWQKELKTTWDSLTKGDYDWSHLAMHLWPERVVPKCATDRSLAIAHGLEDVFWVEGGDGKWKARAKPNRAVEDIVQERTSAAVKEAVQSLLQTGSSSGTVATRKPAGRKKRGGATT